MWSEWWNIRCNSSIEYVPIDIILIIWIIPHNLTAEADVVLVIYWAMKGSYFYETAKMSRKMWVGYEQRKFNPILGAEPGLLQVYI